MNYGNNYLGVHLPFAKYYLLTNTRCVFRLP